MGWGWAHVHKSPQEGRGNEHSQQATKPLLLVCRSDVLCHVMGTSTQTLGTSLGSAEAFLAGCWAVCGRAMEASGSLRAGDRDLGSVDRKFEVSTTTLQTKKKKERIKWLLGRSQSRQPGK